MKIKHALMTQMAGLALMLGAGASSADEGTQQAARLIRAGDILPFGAIVRTGNQFRPGGVITEVDLDEEAGIYIYEVEVVGPAGIEWGVDYDAKTGAVLSQRRDGRGPG